MAQAKYAHINKFKSIQQYNEWMQSLTRWMIHLHEGTLMIDSDGEILGWHGLCWSSNWRGIYVNKKTLVIGMYLQIWSEKERIYKTFTSMPIVDVVSVAPKPQDKFGIRSIAMELHSNIARLN